MSAFEKCLLSRIKVAVHLVLGHGMCVSGFVCVLQQRMEGMCHDRRGTPFFN